MIDTKAVWVGLTGGAGEPWSAEEWLRKELASLPVVYRRDAEGNAWVTLPGAGDRTVALGTSGADSLAQNGQGKRYGIVVGAETIKALFQKFDGTLPCSVSLLLKTAATQDSVNQDSTGPDVATLAQRTAYLELHTSGTADGDNAGVALGMVTGENTGLSARLTTLGLEAVEELTGQASTTSVAPGSTVKAMTQLGVPSAVMFVTLPDGQSDAFADAEKLPLLQAAEAFGRWVEATVHLLAGDEVDLWALQHRVPHV